MLRSLDYLILIFLTLLFISCTKEIDKSKLQIRNGIAYELGSEEPYTGKVVKWNDNGQKIEENTYKDGKKDGPYLTWHSNGQKHIVATYNDNKLDGSYVEWDANGVVIGKSEYKNGEGIDLLYGVTDYKEAFDSATRFATLNFDAGSGRINISKTTGDLFEATTEGRKDNFYLKRNDSNNTSTLDFVMQQTGGNYKNKVNLALNPKPIWNFNFKFGAASMDFDLIKFKVKNIYVEMGAASMEIKLGSLFSETTLSIKAGTSAINIYVPKESGCKIITSGSLSTKQFNEFEKINSDHYETENFTEAANKIYIEIESSVSSIDVEKY